jgi:bla regulator protein blaR1
MIPTALVPLASHLWQSTLFAAVAGLLTLALRRNQARVRYWLWLAASYKFLFPFSWLVSIGHRFEWRAAHVTLPPALSAVTDAVSGPIFLTALPTTVPTPAHPPILLFAIWAIWACGFAAVVLGWTREWLRLHAIARAGAPMPLGLPIRVMSTRARLEPGVFGIFRPVLLLPEGIAGRLTKAQLQAVLAHELCHARRRDNLAAAVHMLVEALFWFHPLIWWLGTRIVEERERVCDEEVLQEGSQARAYAESILKVCELYVESPLTCLSGVMGSDLKKRIEHIMQNRLGERLGTGKKVLLLAAGVAAIALPIAEGVLAMPGLRAQADAQTLSETFEANAGKMAFDVASVKLNKSHDRPTANIGMTLDDTYVPTGGLLSVTGATLMAYLRFAYKTNMIPAGLPDWGRTERFDIQARAQGNPTKDQFRLMLQSLLANRFKLAVHYETKPTPIYALVLAKPGKKGPQLRRDDEPCTTTAQDIQALNAAPPLPQPASSPEAAAQEPPIACGTLMPVPASAAGRMQIAGSKVPIALLARSATNPASGVDRLVIDRTGLNGTFDIRFEWAPRLNGPAPRNFEPDPTGPTFFQALEDQLGLKLVPQTEPVDVLIIDHVERPSEN